MRRRAEITNMYRHAKRAGDNQLMLLAMSNVDNAPSVRCGVTVSVRHGNAVQRNRIKRLCREAFRLEKQNLPAGYDFILAPRKGVKLDCEGLRESLCKLAGRLIRQNKGENDGKGRNQ